jgi:hypothetical protein
MLQWLHTYCSKSSMLQVFHEAQEAGTGGPHATMLAGEQLGEQARSRSRVRVSSRAHVSCVQGARREAGEEQGAGRQADSIGQQLRAPF